MSINDNSQYVDSAIPGAIGFMCLLSEKGPDGHPVMVTSVSDLIKQFGEPSIRRYGQAWYDRIVKETGDKYYAYDKKSTESTVVRPYDKI